MYRQSANRKRTMASHTSPRTSAPAHNTQTRKLQPLKRVSTSTDLTPTSTKSARIDRPIEPMDDTSSQSSAPPPPQQSQPRQATAPHQPGNHMTQLLTYVQPPFAHRDTSEVIVLTAPMEPFFRSVYHLIRNAMFPGRTQPAKPLISAANFANVCRYHTISRIDLVHSKACARRTEGRIPMSTQVPLPRFLAKLINGIGELTLSSGYVHVVPAPEPNPAEGNNRLIHVVTQNVTTQFNSFIRDAAAAGLIQTERYHRHTLVDIKNHRCRDACSSQQRKFRCMLLPTSRIHARRRRYRRYCPKTI